MRVCQVCSLCGVEVFDFILKEFADIRRKATQHQVLLQVVDGDVFALVAD